MASRLDENQEMRKEPVKPGSKGQKCFGKTLVLFFM
jgi:hypothetical protein